MNILGREAEPLGMGCWPIGGAMYVGDLPVGYAGAEDGEALRTIHAALDAGVTLFDTAAAYGAGHSERLLGEALATRPDAAVVTKIGVAIDEDRRRLLGDEIRPEAVAPAIEGCLQRLRRERIDLLLLHQNALPLCEAEPVFAEMEAARAAGKIGAFGWSTDIGESVRAMAGRAGFAAVEHAMNVLLDVPRMRATAQEAGVLQLVRSPLAMGLLSGKYLSEDVIPAGDIRATGQAKTAYFSGGRAAPEFLAGLEAVRELLSTGGRSLVQGALGWIWARSPAAVPVPGAKTVAQIEELAGALVFGPLPETVMAEIEQVVPRVDEADRPR